MKYSPILFSGPMVRAILDGSKTQTRRIIKPQPHSIPTCPGGRKWFDQSRVPFGEKTIHKCPQGQPGDQLWVRETWATTEQAGDHAADASIVFRATDPDWQTMEGWKWKPSIFLPRAYSRITLEVTDVRVQRLNDITPKDAYDELDKQGQLHVLIDENLSEYDSSHIPGSYAINPLFRTLWESINGPGSWQANPYVWAITFRRIKP